MCHKVSYKNKEVPTTKDYPFNGCRSWGKGFQLLAMYISGCEWVYMDVLLILKALNFYIMHLSVGL